MSTEAIGLRLIEFYWLTKYEGDRGSRPIMDLTGLHGDTTEQYIAELEKEVLRMRGLFSTLTEDLTDPTSAEIIVSWPGRSATVWRKV